MFKTYMRLLGFARPIKRYAIPYGIFSLLYALFNTLTFGLIIPILNTMFDDGFTPEYVEKLPPLRLDGDYRNVLFNYAYSLPTIRATCCCCWPSWPSSSAS